MQAHKLSSYTVLIQTIDPCGGGVKGQNIFVLKEVKPQLSLLYQDNCPLWGFCICSSICYAILCVGSSFTIILIKKRESCDFTLIVYLMSCECYRIKKTHRFSTVYNGKNTYFSHKACRYSWIKFQACQARLRTCSKWTNICASHLPFIHFEPCSKCLGTRCDVKNKFCNRHCFPVNTLFSIKIRE